MNDEFKEYIKCAVYYNGLMNEYIGKICTMLTEESPSDNLWYYRDGFFRVDVVKEDYDKYIEFIEDVIGCSYCHLLNRDGLTFMMSLTTLNMKL